MLCYECHEKPATHGGLCGSCFRQWSQDLDRNTRADFNDYDDDSDED